MQYEVDTKPSTPVVLIRPGQKIVSWDRTKLLGEWAIALDIQHSDISIAITVPTVPDFRVWMEAQEEPDQMAMVETTNITLYLHRDVYPAVTMWVASPDVDTDTLKQAKRYFREARV